MSARDLIRKFQTSPVPSVSKIELKHLSLYCAMRRVLNSPCFFNNKISQILFFIETNQLLCCVVLPLLVMEYLASKNKMNKECSKFASEK